MEWGTWSSTLILFVNVVQAVIGGATLALTLDVWRRSRR